jgi:hypothetical protein
MPRRIQHDPLTTVRSTVKDGITALAAQSPEQAKAVQALLDYAERSREVKEFALGVIRRVDLVPFAVPIESGLHMRAYDGSNNLTADVLEGWVQLIDGEWEPTEPVRAPHGQGMAKSVMNIRVPRSILKRIEATADAIVAANGWSTARGYKLNARQITVQWMELLYPAPAAKTKGE